MKQTEGFFVDFPAQAARFCCAPLQKVVSKP